MRIAEVSYGIKRNRKSNGRDHHALRARDDGLLTSFVASEAKQSPSPRYQSPFSLISETVVFFTYLTREFLLTSSLKIIFCNLAIKLEEIKCILF